MKRVRDVLELPHFNLGQPSTLPVFGDAGPRRDQEQAGE
jgi:hypothetical protein